MKAAVCSAYGPPEVLQVREVPEPGLRDDTVRIRQFATAVTASDSTALQSVRSRTMRRTSWGVADDLVGDAALVAVGASDPGAPAHLAGDQIRRGALVAWWPASGRP
jgi:NADPH:quinone reductase-like Zn-dependent oxidoreductase